MVEGLQEIKVDSSNAIPDALLEAKAEELHAIFKKSLLLTFPGPNEQKPIFLSVLLHGNEHTGFYAVQTLLRKLRSGLGPLQSKTHFFFANLEASAMNLRKCPLGDDYNRIWQPEHLDSPASRITSYVHQSMIQQGCRLAVDFHNNTGRNPVYSCLPKVDANHLELAQYFSPRAVHITSPKGAQVIAFAPYCTALTLECGLSGSTEGYSAAYGFLEHLTLHPKARAQRLPQQPIKVYEAMAKITIPSDLSFGFDPQASQDIHLKPDIEALNFTILEKPTVIAHRQEQQELHCLTMHGERTSEFLDYHGSQIVLKEGLIPSMFTTNVQNIKDDCLCYLMQEVI